jgi:Alanine dehydrogenase/PNT, N-terminal domain
MRIGIPKEVKNHEYRVAATPAGVHELTALGHDVVIERGAGEGSAIPDDAYGAVTLSYVQQLAEKGFAGAVADNPGPARGRPHDGRAAHHGGRRRRAPSAVGHPG